MKHNKSSSVKAKKDKKEWTYFDEYFDFNSFKKKPVSEQWLMELAKRLVFWARDNEDALILNQFFTDEGIGKSTVANWKKRNERFNMSYDFAKQLIGIRREVGALKKKLDTHMIMFTMPQYSESWKELEEWRSSLKVKEQEKVGDRKITIVMEKFPTTNIVPEKQKVVEIKKEQKITRA